MVHLVLLWVVNISMAGVPHRLQIREKNGVVKLSFVSLNGQATQMIGNIIVLC